MNEILRFAQDDRRDVRDQLPGPQFSSETLIRSPGEPMAPWQPDPKLFSATGSHRAIEAAREAPVEELAYVTLTATSDNQRDGIAIVDTTAGSATLGQLVGRVDFPTRESEAPSAAPSGNTSNDAHPPRSAQRYFVAPSVRSSCIHVIDTEPDPRAPTVIRTITRDEIAEKSGCLAPHSVQHGPNGIYISALGTLDGAGLGGEIFTLDPSTFDVGARWEQTRGPMPPADDHHWSARHRAMVTSEWGPIDLIENGLSLDLLDAGRYGHTLHVWDLTTRAHEQTIDLGPEQQIVMSLCPAHNPARAYGFAGVVMSREDLSASVFLWYLGRGVDGSRGVWHARKVITIPARPVTPGHLPPLLRERYLVPPLTTNITLSTDDRWLYVSCWGSGELRQYDVTDPFNPILAGSVRLGGIVRRGAHPGSPGTPRNGGPQMTTISRDGRSVYVTNALHTSWDDQFYPEGLRGWMTRVNVLPGGGIVLDPDFLVELEQGVRPHDVCLRPDR